MDMHIPFRHKWVQQLQGHNPEPVPQEDVTKKMDTYIGLAALILLALCFVADHKQPIIDFITRFLP